MATPDATAPLPWNLGTLTGARVRWALVLLAGIAFGAYAYAQQLLHGEIVTNLRTMNSGGVGWGLYIVAYVFFIGVSFAGIAVAALIRLLGLAALRPLARSAELLTLVMLVTGSLFVIADLGRPHAGLLNLPRYARPSSPFFGTFTMVIGGYLFASLVFFFLSGRADAAVMAARAPRFRWLYRLWASGYRDTPEERARHHATSFWLALFILPMLVTAHSTLGFIFGIQGGRPGWFSALQAPSFVVMAGVSGIGVLIVLAAVVRRVLRAEDLVTPRVFTWLGNLLWVLVVVALYFIVSEELTMSYAANAPQRHAARVLLEAPYRPLFLLELGSLGAGFLVLFLQFATRSLGIGWTVFAGVAVNVAAALKRYLLVVPSQTHGMMLPWPEGQYTPSWVEVGVVVGLSCLAVLLYSVFTWVFPVLPLARHEPPEEAPRRRPVGELPRRLGALGTLALGLGVSVAGFLLSNRFGTKEGMDPLLPGSPVLFIVGVMIVFASAAVYEVWPRPEVVTRGDGR